MEQSTPQSENELISRAKQGDRSAFAALYEQHVDQIFAYTFYRVRDRATAEDLTSTTFLRALNGLPTFDPRRGTLTSWLFRIARNSLTDHYRQLKPVLNLEDHAEQVDTNIGPAEQLADKERRVELEKLLTSLTEIQREVLLLRFWDNLSFSEIAAITGKSEAACKMQNRRALDQLRLSMGISAILLLITYHL